MFGKYEILRQIGAGGMGEIFVARQTGIPGVERSVVIKKVLHHLASEPGFTDRFLDEMRVAAMLTHGNIVQVYEAGELDGQYFMAMEFVDGMDLRQILAKLGDEGGRMPEDLALYVLSEAAKGLSYAHTRRDQEGRRLNIVHRDVSPANMLVSWDGQVKLTDFGVALATARLSLSVPGTLHGKVAYMSPEQVVGKECDVRSDVFGLGVVAYETLTGKRPFDAETDVATIEQVRLCNPVPICEAGPWVSASLGSIITRALSIEREERYGSMEEFHTALVDYMVGKQITVSAVAVTEFMAGLKSRDDARSGKVPGSSGPLSLDDIASELLRQKRAELESGAGPEPAVPAGPGREAEPEWSMLQVLGAVLIVGGMVGGLWLVGRMADVPSSEVPDSGPVVLVQPDVADSGPGAADPPMDSGPLAADLAPRTAASYRDVQEAESRVERVVRRQVGMRSEPEGARVYHGKRLLGTTPVTVSIPQGGSMRLDIRKDRYTDQTVLVGQSSPSWITVKMVKEPRGRLKFRFFPANASVLLDGKPINVKGNVVDREIIAGGHEIEMRSASGRKRKTVQVTILADRTTQLGTIELGTDTGDVQ